MAEEIEEEVIEKKSGGNMVLILIVVLLVVLLVGGGLAAFFLLGSDNEGTSSGQMQQNSQSTPAKRKSSGRSSNYLTIGPMYPMSQFVVNLLSESGSKYLKVALDIELDSEELAPEMDKKKALLRDIIIRALSSKTFEEVSTMKGKDRLKDEIVNKINDVLTDGQIKNIFFTDFIVQ
ncbi:flagellar basal body-associated protein FliL [Sulfurospirillum arcachonense]|uniref:flagellar basal body-associated protein FliL n=1 Tax=Sulfurospirillum arcachonense TaxID=57666 RepID=UPI00046A8ECB|nr:flagellar basal body-associated protein FliL [Sulfurospirillum arcachonense]